MPKITISKNLFFSLLGKKIDSKKLEEQLVCAKAELDDEDETSFKIELNDTNRPDLWTTAGLVRQLKTYHYGARAEEYSFFSQPPAKDKRILVDESITSIRPYVCGFIISGKKLDTDILEELIQIQEKICDNFGQNRKAVAIGIYREDKISWPVLYSAKDPATTSFVALGDTEEKSLRNICLEHQKGKEYAHLLTPYKKYPLLEDSKNQVLSMPPVINSAFLGAVEVGDEKLFVEATGDNLEMLLLASAIFACDCYDLGFSVQRVESEYTYSTEFGDKVVSPQYFQKPVEAKITDIKNLAGKDLDEKTIALALEKMGLVIKAQDKERIKILPPVYRNDFLHSVDLIEDIIIGHGLSSFTPILPKSFTVGRLHKTEVVTRRVISTMCGLGFQEMLFPYLGSEELFVNKMYAEDQRTEALQNMVRVSNPISENYELVRASALPNLLEAERISANSPYPHRICEIGKVVVIDNTENYGTRTDTVLSFLIASPTASFTEINSVIAAILYYENIDWQVEEIKDSRFIDMRCGKIIDKKQGDKLGVFGEINPSVLERFDITMPCVAGELRLDVFTRYG